MIGRIDGFFLYERDATKASPRSLPAFITVMALTLSSIAVVAMLSLDAARAGLI